MRKISAILLALLLAVGTTVTAFAAEEDATEPVSTNPVVATEPAATQEPTTTPEPVAEKTVLPGDVNGDGTVDVSDATAIQLYIAELLGESAFVEAAADVNGDGAINVRDASLIQLYAAELIDSFDEGDPYAPKELTLSETEVTLGVGESVALTTSYTEEDGAVIFSSDNEAVVAVSLDGVLTARAEGEAIIKASAEAGAEAQCHVTVGKAVSDIQLSTTVKTLGVGEQFQLIATIPENEISYRQGFVSADEAVAVIDENGLVTAIAPGETTLSYQAHNGKSASCALTVKAAAQSVSLNKTSLFLKPGEQFDLDSYVPEGQAAASRVFTSSNPSVAQVKAAGGIVTAVKEGVATVTVTTYNGKTAACEVVVSNPLSTVAPKHVMITLGVGETYAMDAIYDGNRVGYGATFASDKPEVLGVDAKTGMMTAKKPGYATMTVKSFNGKSGKCYVTVKKAPTAVSFTSAKVNMVKGETVQFYLRTNSNDEALFSATYESSDSTVVSVSKSGTVSARQTGTATITATAYNGKSASVVVTVLGSAGSKTQTTTAAVGLRTDASWKASNIEILSKGTKVVTFGTSSDGRWIKAQHGHNYGWIYNKALGAGKNYSTINLNTLPAVADDLIFDLNLNQRAIYNYVYDISYRNSGSDTTENLCVEAFKYGRGSCYHHAAMIDYLYNRCGWETITVYGIDDYTGGSDHAWCMTKTTAGWRHVDAQAIISYAGALDNSKQYFVTDNVIDDYFTWNRSAYPAAN